MTQSSSRALLRHPFFLRVYGENYEGQSEIPTEITSDELILKWLYKKFEFSGEPDDALWLHIKQVAEAIYIKNQNGRKLPQTLGSLESIEVDKLIGLEWRELVIQDILVKTTDEDNRSSVRFYYSQVLYYLISRHVLLLDKLDAHAFGEHLPILLESHVLQGALLSHLRSAPASHSRELENQISGRALAFLKTYSEIFDRLAPGLRPSVLPYTHGEMGLAYIAYDPILVYFGFYAVSPETPNYVTPVVADSAPDSAFKAMNKLGCLGIRGGGDNFVVSEPRLAAARLACKQIKEVIDRGQLDERQSRTFMVEAVLAILGGIEIRRKLRLGYGTYRMSLRQALLPLDLADLSRRIQEYFGVKKHLADWTEEQVRIKSAYVTFQENGHSMDLSGFDALAASLQVKEEVKSGANFASGRYPSEQELSYLLFLIEQLKLQGVASIDSDIYPAPDLPITKTLITPLEAYSNQQLEALIRTFFEESYSGFIALVEGNFGRISSLLNTFGKRPYRIIAGYSRVKPPTPQQDWGWIEWGLEKVNGIATEVRVLLNPGEQFFSRKPDNSLLLGGCDVEYVKIVDIHRLFNPSSAVCFNRLDRDGASKNAPIRAFAYSLLQQDWKDVAAEKLLELLDKA